MCTTWCLVCAGVYQGRTSLDSIPGQPSKTKLQHAVEPKQGQVMGLTKTRGPRQYIVVRHRSQQHMLTAKHARVGSYFALQLKPRVAAVPHLKPAAALSLLSRNHTGCSRYCISEMAASYSEAPNAPAQACKGQPAMKQ